MGANQSQQQLPTSNIIFEEEHRVEVEEEERREESYDFTSEEFQIVDSNTVPLLFCNDLVVAFSTFLSQYDLLCLAQVNRHLHALITKHPAVWGAREFAHISDVMPPLPFIACTRPRSLVFSNIRMSIGLFMKICIVVSDNLETLCVHKVLFDDSYFFASIFEEFSGVSMRLKSFEWMDQGRFESISRNTTQINLAIGKLIGSSEMLTDLKMNHNFEYSVLVQHPNIHNFTTIHLCDMESNLPEQLATIDFRNLQSLDFTASKLSFSLTRFLNDNLKSLAISSDPKIVNTDVFSLANLESLHFGQFVSSQNMKQILLKCKKLQHLQFSNNMMQQSDIIACASALEQLQSLIILNAPNDTHSILIHLIGQSTSTLKKLHFLSRNESIWTSRQLSDLLSVLSGEHCPLQELKLSGNLFPESEWLRLLTDKLSNLRSLLLSMNRHDARVSTGVPLNTSNLRELFTTGTCNEDLLRGSHNLSSLCLSSSGLTWSQFCTLATCCGRLHTFQTFNNTIAPNGREFDTIAVPVLAQLSTTRIKILASYSLPEMLLLIVCLQQANHVVLRHDPIHMFSKITKDFQFKRSIADTSELMTILAYVKEPILEVIRNHVTGSNEIEDRLQTENLLSRYERMCSSESSYHTLASVIFKRFIEFLQEICLKNDI